MVPVVNIKKIYPVTEQERLQIENHFRRSEKLSTNIRQNSLIISPLRQNYV
jgi:UTP-glucose-1-phosphate uridylyltransferase